MTDERPVESPSAPKEPSANKSASTLDPYQDLRKRARPRSIVEKGSAKK